MKRSYFLKSLFALPFGPRLAQRFYKREDGEHYLINKFFVAGFQYYEGPSIIENINSGEELILIADPKNIYDKFAVSVFRNEMMIGHVPRTDNKHISRLLRQGVELVCKTKEVNSKADTWNMLKVEIYL